MTCQKVTLSDGRSAVGQNLEFTTGLSAICHSQGGVGMILGQCWEHPEEHPELYMYPALCVGAGVSYVIQNLPDSLCPKCLGAPPPPDGQWDCVNGDCNQKERYGTPGQYPSLAACQAACGGGDCDGECVSAAEMAAHQAAVQRVKNTFCQ